ncbi:hypothetical protein ABW20_dc0106753 [Dactylellina cionopaga]|nr:hypothetical protein ABW20_dc0106753 [Dactylellina cionopaga]
MAGQQPYGYYGPDYRSQRQPAARNPYRASTGNAASLYGAHGGGGGGGRGGHFQDNSDDWSSSTFYGDDQTDDSVSEDFQRMSLGAGRHHGGGGGGAGYRQHLHQQPPQLPPQQLHPQAKYNSYAANVAAGRTGGRSLGGAPAARSQRAPSPTDSSYSQTTTSASTYQAHPAHHQSHIQQATAFHANRHAPSKSLDRLSHYLPRGYRLAGPYRDDDEENLEPEYRDDRARGVIVPARSGPRTRSARRQSSPDARGREEFMGKPERDPRDLRDPRERGAGGPAYYSQSEKAAAYRRSMSQDHGALREPREQREVREQREAREQLQQLQQRERHGRRDSRAPPTALLRRSSSIGRFDSLSQADKTETPPPPSGALVRRSKSVGTRDAYRRRRSLGPPQLAQNSDEGASTAVRLDLGGRDVDIAINDGNKRRGPAIGSITINQHHGHKDGLGAPSESGRTRTTGMTEYEEKMRRFQADFSSSPPTSPEMDPHDEFAARMERKLNIRQRPRSASLGTALPRRQKVPLQIAPPPTPGVGPVPPTPGGTEPRHTRISRKIVTRQALEELAYNYEDTGDTFTVFEILQPEQIDQLMDMTARIRAARHDRRRARSRGERQGYNAEFRFDDYGSRKTPTPRSQRPVVNQEEKPYAYRDPPPTAGPSMPGSWPTQPPPERRNNLPMPDHMRFQRPGPSTLGGPPTQQQQQQLQQQQPAAGRYGRREGAAYYR